MAMQCDKPEFVLTDEIKRNAEKITKKLIAEGKEEPDFEIDVEVGFLQIQFCKDKNTLIPTLWWADRDGAEDYVEYEEWVLNQ